MKVPREKNIYDLNLGSIESIVMGEVLMRMKTGSAPEIVFQPVTIGFAQNEVIVTSRSLGIMREGSTFIRVCWKDKKRIKGKM